MARNWTVVSLFVTHALSFTLLLVVSPSSQTINLLTCALPLSCVEELTPEPGVGSIARAGLVYRGRNMEAVSSIMRFLEMRVDRVSFLFVRQILPSEVSVSQNPKVYFMMSFNE